MDCKLCRERLQDYLDSTLEASEQAEVGAHVAECEACRRELDELRKLVALVGSLDEVPEPMGFLQAVRERIDRPTVWERIRGLLTQPPRPGVSVAIPVIIIAFVGVFLLTTLKSHREKTENQPPPETGEPFDIAKNQPKPDAGGGEHGYLFDGRQSPGGEAAEGHGTGGWSAGDDYADADRSTTMEGTGPADETGGTFDRVTTDSTTAKAGPSAAGGEDRERLDEETDRTKNTGLLGATASREQKANGSHEVTAEARITGTVTTDDIAKEAAEQEEQDDGRPIVGAFGRGQEGAERDKLQFQVQAGDEALSLAIFDLDTDMMKARKIAEENGGRAIVERDRNVIRGLLLLVPDAKFETAVNELHLYNDQNMQALERQRERPAKDMKGPQTLRLIIRRFIEGMNGR